MDFVQAPKKVKTMLLMCPYFAARHILHAYFHMSIWEPIFRNPPLDIRAYRLQ